MKTELACIGIKILRACMKSYIDAGTVIGIGNHYELRAFLVPIPKHDRWDTASRKKALRIALRNFRELVKEELSKE
jgi:hypothetical protein